MAENNAAQPSIYERISAAITPQEPAQAGAEPAAAQPEVEPVRQDPEPAREPEQRPEAEVQPEVQGEAAEAPAESEPAQEPAQDEIEYIEIGETFKDLADHLSVPIEDLYGLKVNVEIDGQPQTIEIGKLKDAYRQTERLEIEAARTREAREKFETESRQQQEHIQRNFLQSANILDQAEKALTAEFQSINWTEKEQEDPGEAALLRQRFAERQRQIEQAKTETERSAQEYMAQQQQFYLQRHQDFLNAERRSLLEAIPAWQDSAVYEQERSQMREYLQKAGFSSQEIDAAADHRLIVLAKKAMAFDAREQSADVAKKRVVRIGKRPSRPGSTESKAAARQDREAGLKAALRKSGKVDDAAAIIRARLER